MVLVFYWDNNSQLYRVLLMICFGVDICCQDYMRYIFFDLNWVDKYQEDSLVLYVYLSNVKEIIEMKRSGFYIFL